MDKSRDQSLRVGVHHVLIAGVWLSAILLAWGLAADSGWALRAGLIVIITTPILRVLLLAVGFAFERDWLFAAVSACVFLMLIAGAVVGTSH